MERTFTEDIADREERANLLFTFCEEVAFTFAMGACAAGRSRSSASCLPRTVTRTKSLDFATNIGTCHPPPEGVSAGWSPDSAGLLGAESARLEDVRQPVQEVLFLGADADASSRKDFVETADKLARVTPSLDKLRRRFGRGAVLPASLLGTAPRGAGRNGGGAQEPEA